MSAPSRASLSKGLAFASAFAALILLALFYSVVSSAVDRAAYRRTAQAAPANQPVAAAAADSNRLRQESMPAPNFLIAGAVR